MGWQKGQSGNVHGRPPARRVEALRIYAEPKAQKAIDKLAAIAETAYGDDPKMAEVVRQACVDLLDRVGMVPPKPREDAESAGSDKPLTSGATPEELEAAAVEGTG